MMKEGSHTIDIVPFVDELDFIGPIDEHTSTEHSQILKGNVIMKLSKALKVKTMTVKFKGHSQVNHYIKISDTQAQHATTTPILPKLKTKVLSKSFIFPAGDHTLPWELEIPNIYPRSFSATKRGIIEYHVELKISLGINKKAIVSDHLITIRRHILSSKDKVAELPTNTYENTSTKFHYEIEAPSVICVEQGYVPISIKCNRPVMFIYTQFIQTEIYRCRNISKAEADMAIMASKKNSTIVGGQIFESFKNGDVGLSKFFKRIQPVSLNTIEPDENISLPLLLVHDLKNSSLLIPGIESLLVSIYHQLEVTFNFGGGQENDEIRAKIPVLVSSVPDAADVKPKKKEMTTNSTTAEKYMMESRLHRTPVSVEIIDTTIPLKKKLSNRSTLDEPTVSNIKNNLQVKDENITIKRSVSDQNLQHKVEKNKDERRRSITPPPPFTRPDMINTQLANKLENNMSITSPYTPTRPTLVTSTAPTTVDLVIQPPMESFTGLPPPPRRARKKESSTAVHVEYARSSTSRSSSVNSRVALPLPPLPTNSDSSVSSNSRPTSPMSVHTPNSTSTFNYKQTSDYISTPPQSPQPPSTPRTILRLNQSKSSCTTSSIDSQLSRKRSNSTDNENGILDDYAKSITSHYCSADLPPIPPAITRQKLPSIPSIDKEENRKTRMYYEEESDDEEEDEEDYNYFLQQTFK